MEYITLHLTEAAFNLIKAKHARPGIALTLDDGILHLMPTMKFVDLGLSSRILWAQHNLGVDTNNLIEAKDWYGGYYAWGELETKTYYDWTDPNDATQNYKYANGDWNKLTRYCNKSEDGNEGYTDELTQLVPTDDAATVTNSTWRMPTKELCEELIKYTNNYWVNNYNPNKTIHNPEDDEGIQGLKGYIFEGNNRNLLFIPAAGCYDGSDLSNVGIGADLWSSSLDTDDPSYALHLYFYSDVISTGSSDRCGGFSVRPVLVVS